MKAALFKTIYTMNLEPFSVNKFCKQVSIVISMVLGMANTHEHLLSHKDTTYRPHHRGLLLMCEKPVSSTCGALSNEAYAKVIILKP